MRYFLLPLLLGITLTTSLRSQVTLTIEDLLVCEDQDSVCVPVTVNSPESIASLEMSIIWQGAGLSFDTVLNQIVAPGASFFTGRPGTADTLNISWSFVSGVTFNPGDTLFLLKFLLTGGAGTYAVQFYPESLPNNNNYPVPPVASGPSPFPIYTVTAVDGGVQVLSNTPTFEDCPADISVSNTPGSCSGTATWTPPTVVDCDSNNLAPTSNFTPGATFPVGSTTVTYIVTDTDGNSDTCNFVVTVNDEEDPEVLCPTIPLMSVPVGIPSKDVSGAEIAPTATDNCGVDSITIELTGATTLGPAPFDTNTTYIFNVGVTTIIYTAIDSSGNTDTCITTLEIIESDEPPITLRVADVTLDCDQDTACVAITVEEDVDLGTLALSLVWDGSGLTFDSIIDKINAPGQSITFGPGMGAPLGDTLNISWIGPLAGVSFNAGDTLFIMKFLVTGTPVDSFFVGFYPETLSNPNNYPVPPAASTPFPAFAAIPVLTIDGQVVLDDDDPPMITCPTDVTVQCGLPTDTSATGSATAVDDCTPNPVITFSDSFEAGCGNTGLITRTFVATDGLGQTDSCAQIITITDTVPPIPVCQDITIGLDAGGMATITPAMVDGGSADSCGTVTLTGVMPDTFNCSQIGDNTVTLMVEDDCGNVASCTATVTVEDTVPPVAVCQDVTLSLDPSGNATVTPADLDGGSSDNCDTVILAGVMPDSFTCADLGENTVTLTVEDASGNSDTCTATVTVQDTTPPVALCQDITVSLDANGNATISPADVDGGSMDNCDSLNLVDVTPDTFTCADIGANSVTLTVADESGATDTCTATVMVQDTTPPVAVCQDITVQLDGSNQVVINPADVDGGSMDNCDSVQLVSLSRDTFGCADAGTTVSVTLTVADLSGNQNTCDANVTVEDTVPPQAICADALVYLDANGQTMLEPAVVDGGSTDNCDSLTLSVDPGIFTCDDIGDRTTVLTVADRSGNTDTCTALLTVLDTIPPVAVCQDITISLDASGNANIVPADVDGGSTDNCTTVNLDTVTPNSFTCADLGSNIVVLTVRDGTVNSDTCSANVFVADSIPPQVTCPADTIITTNAAPVEVNNIGPAVTDNCPDVDTSFILSGATTGSGSGDASGSSFNEGMTTVTYTVTDAAGNTDSCSFDVTVEAADSLVITCPPDTTVSIDTAVCVVSVGNIDLTVSDTALVDSVWYSFSGATPGSGSGSASGSTFFIGTTTVTYFARDTEGNIDSCSFTVTVLDPFPPVIVCSGPDTVSADSGLCAAVVSISVSITECQIDSTSYQLSGATSGSAAGLPSNVTLNVGTTTVTVRVVDQSGNASTCSVDVTVTDDDPPVLNCPQNVTQVNDQGQCGAFVFNIGPGAMDNCGIASTTHFFTGATPGSGPNPADASGSFFNKGVTMVTYITTDVTGFSDTCSFTVEILDTEPPTLVCPPDLTVFAAPGDTSAVVTGIAPVTAIDNCGAVDTAYTLTKDTMVTMGTGDASGNTFQLGTTTVRYTITDSTGMSVFCTFNVTVLQANAPNITCPADTVINLFDSSCDTIVNGINVVINSDTGRIDTIFHTFTGALGGGGPGDASGTNFPIGVTTVTYTVVDTAGLQATCAFMVTVNDSTPPVLTCVDTTVTVNLDPDTCGAFVDGLIPAVEDCSPVSVTYVITGATNRSDTAATPIFFEPGTSLITFTVTDSYGNTAQCSTEVVVLGGQGGALVCPGDTLLSVLPATCIADLDSLGSLIGFTGCATPSLTYTLSGATSGTGDVADTTSITLNVGMTDVLIVASDTSGPIDSCTFKVTVQDDQPPGIECPVDVTVFADPGMTTAQVMIPLFAGDNCGITDTIITYTGATTGTANEIDTTFNVGVTNVRVELRDAGGNTTICNFTITVVAMMDRIMCPNDTLVLNDSTLCSAVVGNIDLKLLVDSAGVDTIFYILSGATVDTGGGTASGDTFNLGVTMVTYYMVDTLGDTSSCTFNVEVVDAEPPVMNCPENVVSYVQEDSCISIVSWDIPSDIVIDNCEVDTFIGNFMPGDTFSQGTFTVVYVGRDLSGNVSQCSFTIDVIDTIPPTITCPPDTVVSSEPGNCGATVSFDPFFDDNCAVDSVSYMIFKAGVCVDTGGGMPLDIFFPEAAAFTVVLTATDVQGNQDTCSFMVTVVDETPPTLICPFDVLENVPPDQDTVVVEGIAPLQATDNCAVADTFYTIVHLGDTTTGSGDASGEVFNVGLSQVTYVVTDSAGNSDTCQFNVVVNNTNTLRILCPSDTTVYVTLDSCRVPVGNIPVVVVTTPDFIADTSFTLSGATMGTGSGDASGTVFDLGTTQVTYTATDSAGAIGQCSFDVTVVDTFPPVITCPSDLVRITNLDSCGAFVDFPLPQATDNCGTPQVVCTFNSGIFFPTGTTTVTCSATDASGNTTNCSFTVTVLDTLAPVLTCPADITVAADSGICSAVVDSLSLQASDRCGIAMVTYRLDGATMASDSGDVSGMRFNVGVTTVTYFASDPTGNQDSCTFTVTVEDQQAPVIVCPSDTTFNTLFAQDTVVRVNGVDPMVVENCLVSDTAYILQNEAGDTLATGTGGVDTLFPIGITKVTYIVTDGAGNADTCMFEITVQSSTQPKLVCPLNMVVPNDTGLCSAVVDSLAPEIQLDSSLIDSVWYVFAGATAGNGVNDASGDTFNVGRTIVQYFVRNVFGEVGSCAFLVTVQDVEAPILNCPENIVVGTDSALCTATLDSLGDFSAMDNCSVVDSIFYVLSGATTSDTIPGFPDTITFNLGTTNIKVVVFDTSGNMAMCSFPVVVEDRSPPEISDCPADTMLIAGPDCTAELCGLMVQATDDCSGVASVTYDLFGATEGSGVLDSCLTLNVDTTTVRLTVTDSAGNASTCSFTVVVKDTVPPFIQCPKDGNVFLNSFQCVFEGSFPLDSVSDCSGVTVEYTVSDTLGNIYLQGMGTASGEFEQGVNLITYIVTDAFGNTSTCDFRITVIDDKPPVLDCRDTVNVVALPGRCAAVVRPGDLSSVDNCGIASVAWTIVDPDSTVRMGTDSLGAVEFEIGTSFLTYAVFDSAGNGDTCTSVIIVRPRTVSITAEPGTEVCQGTNVALFTDIPETADSVMWTGPAGFSSNDPNPVLVNPGPAQSGTYCVTAFYPDGCTETGCIDITVLAGPQIQAVVEDVVCTDGKESALLQGVLDEPQDIAVWVWKDQNGEVIDSSQDVELPTVGADDSGIYILMATGTNGCMSTDSVLLTVTEKPEAPSLEAQCDSIFCRDESCVLLASSLVINPDFVSWDASPLEGSGLPDDPEGNVIIITPTQGGQYTYSYSLTKNGCESDVASVTLSVLDTPKVEDDFFEGIVNEQMEFVVTNNDSLMPGAEFEITVITQPDDGELTNNGDGSFSFLPDPGFIGIVTFQYRICYVDCPDLCSFGRVTINIDFPIDECVIPTIITPNEDGVNDILFINCLQNNNFPNNSIIIFNQWGDEVFQASPYQNDWDGTFNDKDLPDGTYFYIFTPGNGAEPQKGHITIFR